MTPRVVTSLTNPTVKAVRALHLRKERDETGLFVAEGLKNVTEGVELGHAPRILLYGREAGDHPLLKKAVQATLAAKGEVIEVTQDILAKVSRRDNPQAVVAGSGPPAGHDERTDPRRVGVVGVGPGRPRGGLGVEPRGTRWWHRHRW